MRAFVFVTELISESFLPGRHPLALLPLLDRPLVQHQIETPVEHGVTELTILPRARLINLRQEVGLTVVDGLLLGAAALRKFAL